ncbi:hypothetical protein B0E38_07121 [Streptomyces sp. 111WW2]|nr:hypothetical protein B0E38_07121 [Streptomyces sp. 111WW2]
MALREAADHEQTHAAGDGDVHGGRRGEPLVDRGQVLRREADTGVVDLDQYPAVGQCVTGDLDLGLRRGERGRVLQQLGEQVHEVVDHAAGDLGARHGGQLDALVLLHLGGGGAEHVDQRHRTGPAAAGLLTREDEEVLTVTAHTRGEVVELEQRGELVRVGLAGLQFGDERELTLDEALGAAREVGEHRVDVAPQQGLLGGEADRLAVHVVEGRGHSADLVPGVHTDGLHRGVDVLRVGLGELLDQLGQAVLGDLGRGVLQAAQRADHGPGHDERADQGDAEHEQDEDTGDDGLLLGLVAQLASLLLHVLQQLQLDVLHLLDLGGAVVQPVLVGPGLEAGQTVLLADGAAGVLVGRLDHRVALGDRLEQVLRAVAVDAGEAADLGGLALQRGLGVQPVVLGEIALVGVVRGEGRGEDRALDGRVLLGRGEGRQGARALDHVGVAGRLRHVLREVEQVGDQAVVGLDRLGRVVRRRVRRAADLGQVVQVAGDADEAVADADELAVLARRVDLLGLVEEVLQGPVGLLAVALDGDRAGLRAVGQRAGGLVALLLERGGQLRGLLGHLGQQLHVLELLDVVHRLVDAQRAQRGRRDHRKRQQRHQTGGDPPVAQGYSRAGAGRALGRLGGRLLAGSGRARRLTGALPAVAGLGLARVLGVLGRGADGLGASPALRLRLRRSAAIPLETSLH